MSALQRAIESIKPGTPANFARKLGVLPQHINNWKKRGVPAYRCIAIEIATDGAVTRYELRPDVFGTDTHSEAANG